jgi:hypothetical protein
MYGNERFLEYVTISRDLMWDRRKKVTKEDVNKEIVEI